MSMRDHIKQVCASLSGAELNTLQASLAEAVRWIRRERKRRQRQQWTELPPRPDWN